MEKLNVFFLSLGLFLVSSTSFADSSIQESKLKNLLVCVEKNETFFANLNENLQILYAETDRAIQGALAISLNKNIFDMIVDFPSNLMSQYGPKITVANAKYYPEYIANAHNRFMALLARSRDIDSLITLTSNLMTQIQTVKLSISNQNKEEMLKYLTNIQSDLDFYDDWFSNYRIPFHTNSCLDVAKQLN